MPPAPVSPDRLLALGAALTPLRECARTGAEEVLALYPEIGDHEAQSALEACLDQVADVLRGIDYATSELADRLRLAASATSHAEAEVGASFDRAGRLSR